MQRRKAQRKGLNEDHFLEIGRAPPTVADVARVRAMDTTERMAYWRGHYGQHCIMHHMEGKCEVALTWGCVSCMRRRCEFRDLYEVPCLVNRCQRAG